MKASQEIKVVLNTTHKPPELPDSSQAAGAIQ
jgi:hypothetical protein